MNGRVLVVDDDPAIGSAMSAILQEEGYEARWVDGEDAPPEAISFRPDVVLLDLCMYPVDGCQVAAQLRRNRITQAVPIVVMTALNAPSEPIAKIQPVDVLCKAQFTIEDFLHAVKGAIVDAS